MKGKAWRQTYVLVVRGCQSKCLFVCYILDSVREDGLFALTVLRGCDYNVKRMYQLLVLFFSFQLVAF